MSRLMENFTAEQHRRRRRCEECGNGLAAASESSLCHNCREERERRRDAAWVRAQRLAHEAQGERS
jgi:hypothetical protein